MKRNTVNTTNWLRRSLQLMGTVGLVTVLSVSAAWAQTTRDLTSPTSIDTCASLFKESRDPISLDFQNADIQDIFRVISDVSGHSMVLSPDVAGRSNIMLNEIPWPEAFQIILDNNKLGRTCEDNIIRVIPKATMAAAKLGDQLITEMVRLNYADLKEMTTNLNSLKSSRGKVTSDSRTNTLVMTDVRDAIEDMVRVIQQLDIPTPQVQIESKIVQVNRNFLQELGVQWGFTGLTSRNPEFPSGILFSGAGRSDSLISNAAGGFDAAALGQTGTNGPLPQGFMVDLATEQLPFFGLGTSLISRDGDLTLDLQLSAMERQGKTRIVANPKVSTADNKEAKIRQGERIPFQTFSQNEGVKVEFVDANLELTVTPHITADQMVYLKVQALQNSPDFANAVGGAPRIDTREANTEVLVEDGGTAILGGLHQRTLTENRRSIPYLGDLPIVGLLFKSTLERDTIDELLIFVTPTVIKATTAQDL